MIFDEDLTNFICDQFDFDTKFFKQLCLVGEAKMSEMNFNVKSMLAKKSKYGHTGYLTFAFLPPREAPPSDQ